MDKILGLIKQYWYMSIPLIIGILVYIKVMKSKKLVSDEDGVIDNDLSSFRLNNGDIVVVSVPGRTSSEREDDKNNKCIYVLRDGVLKKCCSNGNCNNVVNIRIATSLRTLISNNKTVSRISNGVKIYRIVGDILNPVVDDNLTSFRKESYESDLTKY